MGKWDKQVDAYNLALSKIGLTEIRGPEDHQEIVGMFKEVGHGWVKDDETAWCAAFVGAMLERAGLKSTRKLNARSYLDWGHPVDIKDAMRGDIVVFSRGDPNGWQGHVAFLHGTPIAGGFVPVVGGNQSNSVNVANYPRDRLLGIRRITPPGVPVKDAEPATAKKTGGLLSAILSVLSWLGGLLNGRRR